MKTIRRLYFHAVAFISLEVVLWGLVDLLRSIVDAQDALNSAQALARALSLILVGVPIFLFHWLWVQRAAAREDEERTAALRAVFLYGVLLATLIPAVQNLLALVNRAFLSGVRLTAERALLGGSQTLADNLIAIAINLVLAAYFWDVLRKAWPALPERETFDGVRRLYRFVWMLYGLLMVVFGAQQALDFAFTLAATVIGEVGREAAVNAVALLVIGTPIWVQAWRVLQNALAEAAERESLLRLGVLYVLALGGVLVVLSAGGSLIYQLLNLLLGERLPPLDFLQRIGTPVSLAVPFGALWGYYGHWLARQIGFEEQAVRRAGYRRLYAYILSLIGLAASVTGLAMLLSFLIDLALDREFLGRGGFREPLAAALAALAVGLPLWLGSWRPMQAEALAAGDAGDHARRSLIRRAYLYLALFAGVIGGMVSAVLLVFTLINAALGGDGGDFANTVLNSLQQLLLFALLLAYHLAALRRDGAAQDDALGSRQSAFQLLVFDDARGSFGAAMQAALARRASRITPGVVQAGQVPAAGVKADAAILPGSLAVNPPPALRPGWARSTARA